MGVETVIIIKRSDIKVRKAHAPKVKIVQNKKKYNRKVKHNFAEGSPSW